MSIILFSTIGYIQAYVNESNISRVEERTGKFEAIFKNLTLNEAEVIKNNVLVNDAGIYKEVVSITREVPKDKNISNFYLYAADEIFFKNLFNEVIKIENGRLPISSDEIIISEVGSIELKKKIGDYVNIKDKSYKIVGIFINENFDVIESSGGITLLDENIDESIINIAINTKSKRNKYKNIVRIANSIEKQIDKYNDSDDVVLNNQLLYRYDVNKYGLSNKATLQDMIINFAIVILSTVFIYGFINISIKERVEQFSILRCIGATPGKIRMLLIKESTLLVLLSIIPGIILSIIVSFVVYYTFFAGMFNISTKMIEFKIYPEVIIQVILFTVISIFTSTIIPIIKVGHIDPIYGMKNNYGIRKIIKVKRSKIIMKLFGYNGELAYKNVRGDNKYFLINTITTTFLLSIFIIFVGFNTSSLQDYKRELKQSMDLTIDINSIENSSSVIAEVNKYKNEIESIGNSNNIYSKIIYRIQGVFSDVKLNSNVKQISEKNVYGEESLKIDDKEYVYSNNIALIILEDEYIKSLLNKQDNNELHKNGVFVLNTDINSKKYYKSKESLFNIKKGEKFKLTPSKYQVVDGKYKLDENEIKNLVQANNSMELIYLGEIELNDIINGKRYGVENNTTLIVSQSFYLNNKKVFNSAQLELNNIDLAIKLKNSTNRESEVRTIKNYANLIGGYCTDNKEMNNYYSINLRIIALVVYLILGLSMVIGAINIINNKSVYIKLRGKEIGTLLAIGINKRRLKKILFLEDLIQWIISSVFSFTVSFISLHIIYNILTYTNNIDIKYIPLKEAIIGSIILLFINILGSYLSVRKIDFTKTTELIRNNE
ncbi:ABC transporter permease [Clostridium ihumii]|uniref:ABC transporter permease n=1 Tax=Clostridium ihumii TaxID=1470356 RepID=UPI000A477392|nr:ABC transporter permease [Clostridium ihumii]